MFRFLPYILKGLWGHRARTMLTLSGTAVALAVFSFVGSVRSAMQQLTGGEAAERTLIVFQENRFCPQSSHLPQDYVDEIRRQAGVAEVVPIKVFTNNCRASLDSIVFQGMPAEKLRDARKFSLLSGDWSSYASRDDAALVGQAVANRPTRDIKLGEKFSIGGVTVLVAGIFESPVAAEENLIYTHLDFLQRARGKNDVGTATQLEVHLANGADPDTVAAAIDERFHAGPVATSTRTKGMFQAQTLADLSELIGLVHWLGYACVGLVLALVATTTVMSVQDRIKEHGVLQTIGLRPARVFRLVVLESALLSTIGGLLGVAIAMACLATSGMSVAAEGVSLAFRPSWHLVAIGALVSVCVGILAGIAPGLQAARTRIVQSLRQAG